MRKTLFAAGLIFLTGPASAALHDPWDVILKEYSKDGWVDYARLKKNRKSLDEYLRALRNMQPAEEKKLSRDQRLAFWINAYNALAVKTILDHYPIKKAWGFAALAYPEKSIKQIKGGFDGIKHKIAGRKLTLNDLENDILRGELNEPRIHFAIVCASIGCPLLRGEAYRAKNLDAQLDDNFGLFLNSNRVQIDLDKKEIRLSNLILTHCFQSLPFWILTAFSFC